jgi:A/G-specific adenine glycosylase
VEIEKEKIAFLQEELLKWFELNGRKFPWRNKSASNYIKIISEVLLQRTKAETVAKYLPKFLKEYPSWLKLGNATEVELIEILKPLGLSTQRGKRLYKLAQELKERKGIFPRERSMVEEMPMMGQYITNAFELFILKKPSPLLDANMARVLERSFGARKLSDIRYDLLLQELASKVVAHKNYIEINWAVLDFASLVCKPRRPKCFECSLSANCQYFQRQSIDCSLPVAD